jgi:pyruvate dehydrogenase E1 component alpha subunit
MLSQPEISSEVLKELYQTMLKIRIFEEKVAELIIKGEITCPTHLYLGQEAIAAGVCANLRNDDWVFSNHRSHGHYIAKGGDINALMAEIYCKKAGCSKGRGGSMHVVSFKNRVAGSSAIVGGGIPIALGVALSSLLQNKDYVSVAFFGDGAVSEGIFYESLNFASLKKLPVTFVCENNLYATHLHISDCLAETNISKKAEIFKMNAVKIDGNNVIEVYKASKAAIEKARYDKEPALIECQTYRWMGHSGASDDLNEGLRNKAEWDYWKSRCPVKMFEESLLQNGVISETEIAYTRKVISKHVEDSVIFARESPVPDELGSENL